jgi:hypothetical protein
MSLKASWMNVDKRWPRIRRAVERMGTMSADEEGRGWAQVWPTQFGEGDSRVAVVCVFGLYREKSHRTCFSTYSFLSALCHARFKAFSRHLSVRLPLLSAFILLFRTFGDHLSFRHPSFRTFGELSSLRHPLIRTFGELSSLRHPLFRTFGEHFSLRHLLFRTFGEHLSLRHPLFRTFGEHSSLRHLLFRTFGEHSSLRHLLFRTFGEYFNTFIQFLGVRTGI